jgi:hypothetical protein
MVDAGVATVVVGDPALVMGAARGLNGVASSTNGAKRHETDPQ